MFREMRRKKQLMADDASIAVLNKMTSGVLSLAGDDGYPYGVPMSYAYNEGKIYFHCALSGHKIDAIRNNRKASFTVIGQDKIVPEKFTTYYISVIAFGTMDIIDDEEEKLKAIKLIADKYSPDVDAENYNKEIASAFGRMHILELTIEHITGKESIELQAKSYETKSR